jgi:hypothetical protein
VLLWLCACRTAAGFLQEGSLDTRTYGKRLLWAVKAAVRGNRSDMDRLVSGGCFGEGVCRNISASAMPRHLQSMPSLTCQTLGNAINCMLLHSTTCLAL